MTEQSWIDWCQKQFADISRRLYAQGYHPERIETLNRTSADFYQHFQTFLDRTNLIMELMAANPEGFHHFEAFSKAKMELLRYTNLHRGQFLEQAPAHVA